MMSKKILVLFLIVNTLLASSAYCINPPRLDLASAQRNAGILAITSGLFALFSGIYHEHLQDEAKHVSSKVTPAEIKSWGIALLASTLTFDASILFFLLSKTCCSPLPKTAALSPV